MLQDLRISQSALARTSHLTAFEDTEFLNSDPCRGVRLQLEFMKPDLAMDLYQIESTLVIFGSARIKSPEIAEVKLAEARKRLESEPSSAEARREVKAAEQGKALSRYYQVARDFGSLVTRESQRQDGTDRTFVVLTGGGPGIMEAGNRGASDAGGISAAVKIDLPFEQQPNPYITPELCFKLHYFNIRKMHFLKRAKALGCFPGGFGTMDELFEALCLIQTGKMPRIPVLLFGEAFWKKIINWDYFVEEGLVSPEDLELITFCETAEEGWKTIQHFYGRGE